MFVAWVLYKSWRLATLGLLTTGLAAVCANAGTATLDWDSETWPSGNLTRTFTGVGNGNISFTVTGETGALVNSSPEINTNNDGGLSPVQDALFFDVDHGTGSTDEITITIDFTHTGGVGNVSFTLFDVDNGSGWVDELQVTATDGSSTFDPTIDDTATCVSATSSNTVEGVCNLSGGSDGNAGFTFSETGITQVTIVYRNTSGNSDPNAQVISLHDVSFSYYQADVSLTKTVNDPTPDVGDTVDFTLTASNAGPDSALGTVVTDALPSGYQYVSDDGGGSYVSGTGVWTVGSIAPSSNATLTITARTNASGDYTNVAELTGLAGQDPDSTPGNGLFTEDDQDSVSVTRNALPIAKLAFQEDGTPITHTSTAARGAIVKFLLYLNNRAESVTDVSLEDVLDPGFEYISGSMRFASTTPSCASLACTTLEDAAIYSAANSGTALTDATDGDLGSISGTTLSWGNETVPGNAQLDVPSDRVWAVLFSVRVR